MELAKSGGASRGSFIRPGSAALQLKPKTSVLKLILRELRRPKVSAALRGVRISTTTASNDQGVRCCFAYPNN